MVTIPVWAILLGTQLLILLATATAILGWLLRRARRAATSSGEQKTGNRQPIAAPGAGDVRAFLENAISDTNAEMAGNDRNLPRAVLDRRLDYLNAELEGLDYLDNPDLLWSHLCDRLDPPDAPGPRQAGAEPASLRQTQQQLQELLTRLQQDDPSSASVRQLAAIERRLAAIQSGEQQSGTAADDEDLQQIPDPATAGNTSAEAGEANKP